MKNIIIIVLVLLGLYWLFAHVSPLPLNHESMGLYEHNMHRIIGGILLVIAALLTWKWKFRKNTENNI